MISVLTAVLVQVLPVLGFAVFVRILLNIVFGAFMRGE